MAYFLKKLVFHLNLHEIFNFIKELSAYFSLSLIPQLGNFIYLVYLQFQQLEKLQI